MARVCVDASLVLLWLLPQELSPQADALWQRWESAQVSKIAPPVLYAEVPSVLREAVFHRRFTPEEGDEAFQAFCELGIEVLSPQHLHLHAWEMGKAYNAPGLYDLHYLALAELERCELWKADRRLVDMVRGRSLWAKWVGEIIEGGGR